MRPVHYDYFMGDFETTVYKGQDHTEVWASAIVPFWTEDVQIHHSIDETFKYLVSLNKNVCVYYHNLKFDGSFWLSYLLIEAGFKQAYTCTDEEHGVFIFDEDSEMHNSTFKYSISAMGQWYSITIKTHDHMIQIRDSLKLLPFSVRKIGKSFGTKHKKLDMEYTGFRYAGCEITDDEKEYIANDVFVVKEALEIMFEQGHKKLTIGSCCMQEYKHSIKEQEYKFYFPDLTQMDIAENIYCASNVDEYVRKSYKGGWCYLVDGKQNKVYHNGTTADVNSLYPSMMHSISGNKYPIGKPIFWSGNEIPVAARSPYVFFFVRLRCRFYLKPGMLPFIQIKHNLIYPPNKALVTSDPYNAKEHCYCRYYIGIDGEQHDSIVELTLTQTDYELFLEHYDVEDFEILDGCYFEAKSGIFDEYIDKYKKIKMTSKGATRELAKLFLNNLYGKLASSTSSNYKVAYVKDDKSIGFTTVEANDKKAGYIACGSAITSYARNFTIRAAQKNYYGVKCNGFIYADTDSIHCDLPPEDILGVPVDENEFCHWKLESCWDEAIFTRQKTYIEHVTHENCQPIDEPYYNVKCAGMPDKCKELFIYSMRGWNEDQWIEKDPDTWNNFTEQEQLFVTEERTIEDFAIGLIVPGKLLPKRIKGGILLTETTYEMR